MAEDDQSKPPSIFGDPRIAKAHTASFLKDDSTIGIPVPSPTRDDSINAHRDASTIGNTGTGIEEFNLAIATDDPAVFSETEPDTTGEGASDSAPLAQNDHWAALRELSGPKEVSDSAPLAQNDVWSGFRELSGFEVLSEKIIKDEMKKSKSGVLHINLSGLNYQDTIHRSVLAPLTRLEPSHSGSHKLELTLLMSACRLSRFPEGIITLEHLTILCLRSNRLRELPPGIAALCNLQNLDVSCNKLRSLPGEMLSLVKRGASLKELLIHPNPFYQAKTHWFHEWGSDHYRALSFGQAELEEAEIAPGNTWQGLTTALRSRSRVQYSDGKGVIYSDFRFYPNIPHDIDVPIPKVQQENWWVLTTPRDDNKSKPASFRQLFEPFYQRASRVPSLMEVCLKAAVRANEETAQLAAMLRGTHINPSLPKLVESVVHTGRTGGQKCCICGRDMLMPMTEWVEFREIEFTDITSHLSSDGQIVETEHGAKMATRKCELWVPFMRKGCSWLCVPRTSNKPPIGELVNRLVATL